MTPDRDHGALPAGSSVQDWLMSFGLHGLLLAGTVLSAWRPISPPPVSRMDLPLRWAEMVAPAPVPLPVPAPAAPTPPPAPKASPVPKALPSPAPRPESMPRPASPPIESVSSGALPSTAPAAPGPVASAPVAETRAVAPPAAAPAPRQAEIAAPSAPAPDTGVERRWQAHLETLLARDKHYPVSARRARQEGVVLVEAHFTADGQLSRCVIQSSSGFTALDDAALAMVRRAADLARVHHAPGRLAQLRIPITFRLEEP